MQVTKSLLSSKPVRYILIGSFSYAVEFCILIALIKSGLSATASTAISFWVGLVVAFILQKFVAFSNRTVKARELSKQSTIYLLLVVFNYAFTLMFVSVLSDDRVLITRTIALGITTTWNFFIYKRLFREETN